MVGPSRTVASCWNPCLSRGCGQLRHFPGESRSPKAAGCGWNAVHGDGRHSASLATRRRAWESGRGRAVGSGRVWVVCPVGNRSPARSWRAGRVQVCKGDAGLTREGGSSSWNLERYSWNKGKHYAGGDTSTGKSRPPEGEGGHGGRTPVAIWEAATGAADPPPSTRPQT